MSNYRIYKATAVSSSVALGKGTDYPNVWGIMRGESNPSGSVQFAGGGGLNFGSIDNHQIIPCYPIGVTVSSGAIIVLE